MPTIGAIERALASRKAGHIPLSSLMRQAAVAAILRARGEGAELLFIRRAVRDGDPWSGHIAFPGGRVDHGDEDAQAAAIRETREEIDLDLRASGRALGELGDLMAKAHGKPIPMVVRPFVFELIGELPAFTVNKEVEEILWLPVDYLLDPRNRGTHQWKVGGIPLNFPCYRFDGHVLWGLTLKMVDELLDLLRAAR